MSAAKANPIESAETPFSRTRAHAAGVETTLSSTEMTRARHSDVEDLIEAQGREWARLMLEEHLALRAALEKPVEVSDAEGVERGSARESERHLTSVVGKVAVPRMAYQAPGREDLHPMDAVLNLPREMFSHGIRRLVAKEAARASFDEVVEMVRDYTGAIVAKRQIEELAVRAAQDFDAFYAQRKAPHDPASELLVLTTDGKGIVMRHEDLRMATRLAAERKVNKLETRLTPGEKSNRTGHSISRRTTTATTSRATRTARSLTRYPHRSPVCEGSSDRSCCAFCRRRRATPISTPRITSGSGRRRS